ncbi:37S ribosomal protein S7, mitochondrial [[Candida] jaroonii]|uniref:37S ribosomal protein S7, mitochondrial n=1 Tax=[Candida] jaroonii TaxID=467808 RepID=A0ACA9YAD4_9ASCO|nr:37S ribosomal protein S7, mitochondrial [[Candida] jaroonii]
MSLTMIRFGSLINSLRTVARPTLIPIKHISYSTIKYNNKLINQVYPINKEEITEKDVDDWLLALKRLRDGHSPDNETEVYIKELTETEDHLKQEFIPNEQQILEQEKFLTTQVPIETIPVVDQLVNLIMRDGKKSKARRIVSRALYIVYLRLRKDPVVVLKDTLEQLSPLLATKTEKTGTAKNRIVPYPLSEKQRYRYAFLWMLDSASKKKSSDYSVRLAEEIINSYEGKSSGYEKRAQMHKTATAQRAYVRL